MFKAPRHALVHPIKLPKMFVNGGPLSYPRPFWFASEELLTHFLGTEVSRVNQFLAKYPDLPGLFDAPEATIPQRRACFALLAHRKVMEMIYDTFAGRYQDSPSLGDEESNALRRTNNLVAADAPAWVLEMHQVVERLPAHIYASLPEPLRRGGFNPDDAEQMRAIQSATETLKNVEQIQALIERVLDQQLQRLARRWSVGIPKLETEQPPATKANRPKGTEGLVRKNDLSQYSRYMDNFTEKQLLAFVLKYEYGLKLSQIALRMGIDRKTADEHIKAAEKKVNQARSNEKRKARRAKNTPEF